MAAPEVEPGAVTLTMEGSLLLQVPGRVSVVEVSPSTVDSPWHTLVLPVMAAGKGYMVTDVVTEQPAGNV